MRVAVVSDTHLSPTSPGADRNWEAVVAHLAASPPDLVVHGGDLAAAGDTRPADLVHARRRLDLLPAPWRVVPGNHDVGNPWIDRAELGEGFRRFEAVIGERFWSLDAAAQPGPEATGRPGWRLVGLDSQALVTGHPDDESGWAWLAERLATERPVAVFQHRPLAPISPDEVDTRRRYLTEPGRTRFRELLGRSTVRVIVSGHVHQWRCRSVDGVDHVWVPSTWAWIADTLQPRIGAKVTGLVELDLGLTAEARLVVPDGMAQTSDDPVTSPAVANAAS
jgi:3',5'-cyclic AMP phosphodiesterase CpdA